MFGLWTDTTDTSEKRKLHSALAAIEKEKQRAARADKELKLLRDVREGELSALRAQIRQLQQQTHDAQELAAARGDMLEGVRALAKRDRVSMQAQLESGAESRDRLVMALRRHQRARRRALALLAASRATQ